MWRVLSAGFSLYADPRLVVDSSHRREAGLRSLYKRVHREHFVLAGMLGYPRLTVPGLVQKWWSEFPDGSARPNWQRRLSPWRAVELTGEYTGDLAGTRSRGRLARRTYGLVDADRPRPWAGWPVLAGRR